MNDSHARLRADGAMLLASLIWGTAFVAQRVGAMHIGPFLFNGARFLLGAVVLAPAAKLIQIRDRSASGSLKPSQTELLGGAVLGLLLFLGAWLQQFGLQFTTAGKAGFITGLYVVLVPLFLAVWRRKLPPLLTWGASGLAAAGLFLISTGGVFSLAPGDGLELLAACFWALHVIIVGIFAKRVNVFRLALVQYGVCGTMSSVVGGIYELRMIKGLAEAWWTIAYTGAISVGVGYTLQLVGQRIAPAADAAVILSMEAVFAALFGWLFLSETLSPLQLVGGVLMLGAMLMAQPSVRRKLFRLPSIHG